MSKRKSFQGIAVAVAILVSAFFGGNAFAADARNFNPGRIIDDVVFTNNDTMSVQQIQNFLNSKTVCDTYGRKQSELGGGTRAQWLASKGISTPITCLRDYHENPANGENNYGRAIPAGAISAAQIIYNYSQQFGINPQVLLVTLQKENGLITDEWPTPKQYSEAMGFGCPDNVAPGAPACNPAYKNFSTQMYQAARHFRGYINNAPGWWVPFNTGNNSIKWNPESSCGSSTVNIQNRATVALYSYTPYRPNQAALNAQYGKGDSCSAYGNRNFYMYFTDWFGPTFSNSTLVRTISNGTVYLISNNVKYPVPDMDTLNSLNLGGVGFVSQAYLDGMTTGPTMGRLVIDGNGTVYYYDSGIKLAFTSCDMVADYGYSCNQAVRLADWQLNALANGPNMTNFYRTTSGKSFYIKSGQKREVFDEQSLNEIGLSSAYNVISESALLNISYGQPVVRNNIIVTDRNTGDKYIKDQGQLIKADNEAQQQTWLGRVTSYHLDNASIGQVSKRSDYIRGLVKDSLTNENYILTQSGKLKLSDASSWPVDFISISSSFLSTIPSTWTASPPYLIKSPNNSTVYYVDVHGKRGLTSWSDVQKINNNSIILTIPDYSVNSLPEGPLVLSQGTLVKSPSNATVYYVDGLNKLFPLSSFTTAADAGIPLNARVMPEATIAAYTNSNQTLKMLLQCGGEKYASIGGRLQRVTPSLDQETGLSYQSLTICPSSATSNLAGTFFIDSYGTIYQIKNGVRNPIGSWSKYLSLGGSAYNTIRVSDLLLSEIPVGSLLN
jgi:hypothetical protein